MGFSFNGVSSQSMGVKSRLLSWSTVPSLRGNTEAIPGKAGVIDFGAEYGERYIDIYCNIYPKGTLSELVKALDELADWLDPTAGVKQLILDDVPERYFWARLVEEVNTDKMIRATGKFTLRFICPDPYAYSVENEEYELTGSDTVQRQYGNAVSSPIYTVTGYIPSGTANGITITTNGTALSISGPLSRSERLVIDSDLLTATVTNEQGNVLRNGLSYLGSLDFPQLQPKIPNTIEIQVRGSAQLDALSINARSRWK